jgi:hypothetical protein
MNGRKAKQQRRKQYDPRQYQVAVQFAVELGALPPGECEQCHAVTESRRDRLLLYCPQMLDTKSPDESANEFADRKLRDINARQYEGDFSLAIPPRPLCGTCAATTVYGVARYSGEDFAEKLSATINLYAAIGIMRGEQPWVAFVNVAEPGADGRWRHTCCTGLGAFEPAVVYRSSRRDAEVYGYTIDEPGDGMRLVTEASPG